MDWFRLVPGMELDSSPERNLLSPEERIITRLIRNGVPLLLSKEKVDRQQVTLVAFAKEGRASMPELVSAILPADEDVSEALKATNSESAGDSKGPSLREQFRESFLWLQWLMFEEEPRVFLRGLARRGLGQRGVCGAVWGQKDIAYRCRTCENDPTCAICVPCFQNGNHKDHDYSIMYTGGGCCDCGDATAWKREGFCSKHRGVEQIQRLPEEIACSVEPVVDALLLCWRDRLISAEAAAAQGDSNETDCEFRGLAANEFSSAAIEMLLDFSKYSESLLNFVSKRMLPLVGFLDVLVRAERFLSKGVAKKLHELLLKMLGEPSFKYEFAKAFIRYYTVVVKDATKVCKDSVFEKFPLLSTFSVQIFTVSTLTPRLVKDLNLLHVMLGCLGDLFQSCVGGAGYLEVGRWSNLYETTLRLVEDIRYIMSHGEVPKYVIHEVPDMSRTWMELLSLVQGMDPQKRVTGLHVEDENENMHTPFVLGNSIGNINSLLVAGAFSLDDAEEIMVDLDECDNLRHAKIGRLSEQSSISGTTGRSSSSGHSSEMSGMNWEIRSCLSVPSSVTWLIFECLKAIENWLVHCASSKKFLGSLVAESNEKSPIKTLPQCKSLLKIQKGRDLMWGELNEPYGYLRRSNDSNEHHGIHGLSSSVCGRSLALQDDDTLDAEDMDLDNCSSSAVSSGNKVEAQCGIESGVTGLLNQKEWPEITYDVSSEEISFHIPLHRLLSQLLQKALKKCYGDAESGEIMNAIPVVSLSVDCHDFFQQVLKGCHHVGFSSFLMEHPLRLRVFCAEVRAGMWRKNGEAVILSCEWYRSARWWKEGLEFDLFLLQCCAALAPPELFVRRILERFGLADYLSINIERSSEYEPALVQEMLTLIIQIVKERRFCGLSTTENLHRELIYKLSTGDATHSQLVKALPHELSKSDQLQRSLDMLAEYYNPSSMKQGRYSLRKEYWRELDLYHPRWHSRDLQIAEERFSRFCKVSALTTQLPQWTKILPPLSTISRIATCRVVVEIVRAVLFYAVFSDNPSLSRAPDGVLLTTLHLLSLALHICEVHRQRTAERASVGKDLFPVLIYATEEISVGGKDVPDSWKHQSMFTLLVLLMKKLKAEHENNFMGASPGNFSSLIERLLKRLADLDAGCMTKLQLLAPNVVSCMMQKTSISDNQISASTSDAEERKAKVRERQAAIMERMKAAQTKFIESISSKENDESDSSNSEKNVSVCDVGAASEDSAPVVCSLCRDPESRSPMSFLVLLQKSRLATFIERGSPSWDQVSQSDKKHLLSASGTIDSSFNDSTSGQQTEVDAFLDFIKAHIPNIRCFQVPNVTDTPTTNGTTPEMLEQDLYYHIQREIHLKFMSDAVEEDQKPAILDAEDLTGKEFSVYQEYVASLSGETLRHSPTHSVSEPGIFSGENISLRSSVQNAAFDGFGPEGCDGIHISSCGHAVHLECRDRYLSSLKQRYMRRIVFEGGHIVDPDQGEFLCPVCRRFANSVLPAYQPSETALSSPSTSADCDSKFSSIPLALSLLRSASIAVGQTRFLRMVSMQSNDGMRPSLEPVYRMLCRMYFPDRYDKISATGRGSHSLILWDMLRYSIISTEIAARSGKSTTLSGGSNTGLEALYKEIESSTGFVLSLLLNITQTTRSENRLQVLLRFRGMQIFVQSVCSGVSTDDIFNEPRCPRGNVTSLMKNLDSSVNFPDTQFFKRAADPVLAHDPFSSLMWILFCLPLPFLPSTESFIALVHLFYAVCALQALITCSLKCHLDFSEFGFSNRLICDICKIMGDSAVAVQFFVSNYIDSSCHPKDMIRRFTLPYLRRCALLWKLMKSSIVTPFNNNSHGWDGSSCNPDRDMLERTSDLSLELREISELECLFQIVSLEDVLNSEVVHALALKWCKHFCKDFGVRNYGRILPSTPAVPFKLMRLPLLYQDLLQRYIKKQCPSCKSVPNEPALCLLCGRLCSPSWKPCCRENNCPNHAIGCSAGIGVFLLIRKTAILLQRSAHQAPWPSPYLDAFGEEDIDMVRGKPLYLNEERYAALSHVVASHGLDRSSDVLRQMTLDGFFTL